MFYPLSVRGAVLTLLGLVKTTTPLPYDREKQTSPSGFSFTAVTFPGQGNYYSTMRVSLWHIVETTFHYASQTFHYASELLALRQVISIQV